MVKEENKELIKQVFYVSSIGISMVLAILIGLAVGIFLDRHFNTEPYLTFIFLLFGIIAGFRNIFYICKKYGIGEEGKDEGGDKGED